MMILTAFEQRNKQKMQHFLASLLQAGHANEE
jgi:hypothetical protein